MRRTLPSGRSRPRSRGVGGGRPPAVADQQIQARGEYRGDENLAGEIDVVLAGDPGKSREGQGEQDPGPLFHVVYTVRRPNSPRGRNAITTIIGRNRIT